MITCLKWDEFWCFTDCYIEHGSFFLQKYIAAENSFETTSKGRGICSWILDYVKLSVSIIGINFILWFAWNWNLEGSSCSNNLLAVKEKCLISSFFQHFNITISVTLGLKPTDIGTLTTILSCNLKCTCYCKILIVWQNNKDGDKMDLEWDTFFFCTRSRSVHVLQ